MESAGEEKKKQGKKKIAFQMLNKIRPRCKQGRVMGKSSVIF